MLLRTLAVVFALIGGLGLTAGQSNTFRFAFQGGLNSLDPYTLNENFTLGMLGNAMEGLVKRDKDLNIVPGLAERWEVLEPTRWRFHLRHGVKFHDGSLFTADDVLFSVERVRAPGSQLKSRLPADAKAVKVDDHTVDFVLSKPNPILHYEWETWYVMSKAWAEANGADKVQPATASGLSPFALKANGTGPFRIVSHEPGVKTVFRPNTGWWGKPEHNLTEVVLQTISSDATRVAALLSGEMDLIDPVPVQDIARIKASTMASVQIKPELRTIFLNMDSMRDELLDSNIKGKNPFKDARVRRAVYQAIDAEMISAKVMRGMSSPTAIMISPLLYARAGAFKRWPHDVAAAKQLLKEAGYPQGFELTMDCPSDRYVNDEEICQAVAAMLARIDIKVTLNALPKAKYFAKAGPSKYESSFNLLGWIPSSLEAANVISKVMTCRDATGKGGTFNFGGYCNPAIDAISAKLALELDPAKRDQLIADAFRILHEDAGIIPLHQQSIAWGVANGVEIAQRADNQIYFDWVNKQ